MKTDFLTQTPIAHRGLHGEGRPENSLSAFRAAIAAGYAIETDVRFSKDRQLVVFHDDTLLRMTGDGRNVIDCTFEELAALKLNGSSERIPLFTEFLQLVDGRVPLLIELKSMESVSGKELVSALASQLKGYNGPYAVQSFQPLYVKAAKNALKAAPCGVLATARSAKEDFNNSPLWKLKARIVRNNALGFLVKPDFLSYHCADFPNRTTEKFKGVKLAWTVRSPEEEARVRAFADNIIFENFTPRV